MSEIDSTIKSIYRDLRVFHGLDARSALRMAKARYEFEDAGGEFIWADEQESPRDVWGEPCTDLYGRSEWANVMYSCLEDLRRVAS